jgi:hypothetical protein
MNNSMIIALVAVAVVAGGGFYAWSSGLFELDVTYGSTETQETSTVESVQQQTETTPTVVEEEAEVEEEPVDGYGRTESEIQEFEEKPRMCETDADCKIIPITCNDCDCGRPVNIYVEPYACTEADKATPCPVTLDCPAEKAVCNEEEGVCEKVPA